MLMMLVLLEIGERASKEIQLMLMMLVLLLAKSLQSPRRSAALAVGSKTARSERELQRKSS